MSADERYDEAVVDMIAEKVFVWHNNDDLDHIRSILTALADAGLLLPPGGETREEWDIWIVDHVIGRPFRSRAFAEEGIADRRAKGYTWPGEVRRRTVNFGPWTEVPDDPS